MSLIGIDYELFEEGEDLERADGPRYYFINPAAVRWSGRTGRPLIQWLWKDDLDTRKPDEMPPCSPSAS